MVNKKPDTGSDVKNKKTVVYLFVSGLLSLLAGFIILSKVDRMATNWASNLSPIMLICGWLLISAALWRAEK